MDAAMRARLELRRGSAASPHRNRYRETKSGQAPWDSDEWQDMCTGEQLADE